MERAGFAVSQHQIDVSAKETVRKQVLLACRRLAQTVCGTDTEKHLILGGDHAIAMGSWAGMACKLEQREGKAAQDGALGLIWIDAHLDAHTPATTPSGCWHGMGVAHLLGHGEADFASLSGRRPALSPDRLCLIGARSFEPEERRLLDRLKVRIFEQAEVNRCGFAPVFAEAVQIAARHGGRFGLSLDMDAFDPLEAPGVGSPVPGGLRADEVLPALSGLFHHPAFSGLELAEFNPRLDADGRTFALVLRLVTTLATWPAMQSFTPAKSQG